MSRSFVCKYFLPLLTILTVLLSQAVMAEASRPTSGEANGPARPVGDHVRMVVNTSDSGPGSLRQAIAEAVDGDTIAFDLTYPATITLVSSELAIARDLAIAGPGADRLTIYGNYLRRGLHITGAVVSLSGLRIAHSYSFDETADGGGIWNSGDLTLRDITLFDDGAMGKGGGIYNEGTLTVYDSTILRNMVSPGRETPCGGGVYNAGTMTVYDTMIIDNQTAYYGDGGGLYNAGTLAIYDSALVNNAAGSVAGDTSSGGGIYNRGILTVQNVTFSENWARYNGGGLYNEGQLTVTNATLFLNRGGVGGGLYNAGTLNLRNTIVAHSIAGGDCSGVLDQNVGNLIEDGSCAPLYSGDPNLAPLSDNGGDTPTHALQPPSAAIDHGDPAFCPALDQRGYERRGECDIGAYEYAGCGPALTVMNEDDAGPGSLRQALADVCPGGTIAFDLTYPATITLSSGELSITKSVTIAGPGPGRLTVSGGLVSRVLHITGTAPVVSLSGLAIVDGSTAGVGGGIWNEGGTLTVSHVLLAEDWSDAGGGGAYSEGILGVYDTTVVSNTSASAGGGGLYNANQLTVTNATLSGNRAGSEGGGLYNTGQLTVTNVTLFGNEAITGSGLYNTGTLYLRNTIIAHSPAGGDCANAGILGQNANNLVEDGSCAPLYSGDPNLAPLDDNGGDTPTHASQPPSAAIDHGDPLFCPALDQRGYERWDECDIGAYEYFACETALTVMNDGDAGAGSLRQALADVCPGGTIGFSLTYPATITLSSGELSITKSVTIAGPGPGQLAVSGGLVSRVLHITGTAPVVSLSGLAIVDGSTAGVGGGIWNEGGTLTVSHVLLAENWSDAGGGGAYNEGVLAVYDTTAVSNTSATGNGGGLANTGRLTVTNATLSGNWAGSEGGGLFNEGQLTTTNATLFGNGAAGEGGGLYNAGTLYLRNTIIGHSPTGGDCANAGVLGQNANNLVEDDSCAPLYSGDPNLAPLGDNGGDTPTHALQYPNAAIDHGDPAFCPALDQRGYERRGECDIGAYEYTDCLPSMLVVNSASFGPGSLVQSVERTCPGGTVDFYLTYPVTIASDGLYIDKSLTIRGPGEDRLTVFRGSLWQPLGGILLTGAGNRVAISGLTIAGYMRNLYNDGVTLTLDHVRLAYGGAIGEAYGVGLYNSGVLTITNSFIAHNRGMNSIGGYVYGGGIYNAGRLAILNSTIFSNTVSYGSGIYNAASGTMTVTNVTLSENSGFWSDANLYNAGRLWLRNTIVANSEEGANCLDEGTLVQNLNNLIEDGSCNPLYSGDPNLGLLGDHGGGTWTSPLISPSNAIDHGDPFVCPPFDQRGYGRNGVCDIGAYEYEGVPPAWHIFLPIVVRR